MFVKRLRTQPTMCKFRNLREMTILWPCVFSLGNSGQKKTRQDANITLTSAIGIIRTSEVTKTQIDSLSAGKTIDAIENKTRQPKKITICKFCGYGQLRSKCPIYKKTCKKCGQLNHFMKVCSSKEANAADIGEKDLSIMKQLLIRLVEVGNNQDSWQIEY